MVFQDTWVAVRSKTVNCFCWFIVPLIACMGFLCLVVVLLFSALFASSYAIILMGMRKLVVFL